MQSKLSHSFFSRLLNRSKDLLFIAPLMPLWRRRLEGKAMIYLHHRIQEEGEEPFLDLGGSPTTSPDQFRKDIRLLKKLNACFVRFSELAQCDFDEDKFYVVICADDGFASNYQLGMKIADEEQIPLTIFQCSEMLKDNPLIWEHQLYFLYHESEYSSEFRSHLDQLSDMPRHCDEIRETVRPQEISRLIDSYLEDHQEVKSAMLEAAARLYPMPDELRSASRKGHEICSHGASHYMRRLISKEEFEFQLQSSKLKLDAIVGRPTPAFSYPFNSYHPGDELVCARYFSMVATVDGGAVNKESKMLAIPRNTYPGRPRSRLRHRRWILTGAI